MKKACIDVGSNSVLLLVEEKVEGKWHRIIDSSTVTGLGEAVKSTGSISQESMARTLPVLKNYFETARNLGCPEIIAAGTMAVRMAKNQAQFLDLCQEQRTPVEVLSGADEARLGLESVIFDPHFANQPRVAVIDPGGQSTEITVAVREGSHYSVVFSKSFPVGTLGLRSNFVPTPSPTPEERFRAMMEVDQFRAVSDTAKLLEQGGPITAIVLGASATNLASIQLELPEWNPDAVHGYRLSFTEVSILFDRLCDLDDPGRATLPGIEPGRESTIHIGALIIERALSALDLKECYVSVRGWRYALLERGLNHP